MMIIYFLTGLSFGGIGLAAFLQIRRGGNLPLSKQLPLLAAFGFTCALIGWIDMFLFGETSFKVVEILDLLRLIIQPLTGLLLLLFGWGILSLTPLPTWTIFLPGMLIVPVAYVITYAATTFITPSPIEIPIDIWSRYLLYLPGSILAGIGFLRQWKAQSKLGYYDISNMMLGAGVAFLFEAIVVGLVVPAAPHGPASYYNYDRVIHNAFIGEKVNSFEPFGLTTWLDYNSVLRTTGLPIQFWRMLSAFAVAFFTIRGLDIFEAIRRRKVELLRKERDYAQRKAFEAQITSRQIAENWTEALININRQITELKNIDSILLFILENVRKLLRSEFIGLALLNENRSQLLLKCYSQGNKSEMLDVSIVIENPMIWNSIQSNRSYHSQSYGTFQFQDNTSLELNKQLYSTAIVPINMDDNPIGALWINRGKKNGEPYTDTDLIWLECIADEVVIAIQHGVMTSRLQSLSIVEERARIAREMHDGLAQVLGYLNLQVQTLEALFKQGKMDSLQDELARMRDAIKISNADVRENILSLRTTLASENGLVPAISEYLEEFGIQTRIDTKFQYNIENKLNISSIAEVQLVCILKEALANVRKHAHATQVSVLISEETIDIAKYIHLEISDNGIGLKETDSKRSFGLKTMSERALNVKGHLTIRSLPGKGTTISCYLPCLKENSILHSKVLMQ